MPQQVCFSLHPGTFLAPEELGSVYPYYQPTFPIQGDFINGHHKFLANALNPTNGSLLLAGPGLLDDDDGQPIAGWLRSSDALKLYELGYCCDGDILELGTYEALSTCILAQAVCDAGRSGRLVTVDIDRRPEAVANARRCGLDGLIDFRTGDAVEVISELGSRRFGFIFVDHSHTYSDVKAACELLPGRIVPGGFVLFHDYNDPRNGHDPDYGVYQAVAEAMLPEKFQFCGVYGCTALYRDISQES